MPLMKCDKCHHEWETMDKDEPCDWCDSPGTVLEEKTALEELGNFGMNWYRRQVREKIMGRKDS